MTFDVVALCRDQPDVPAVISALMAAGPQWRIRPVQRGGLVQLCDDDGQPLLTIEGPILVQVAGEAERLLGTDLDPPHPVWWVEARAADRRPDAAGIARRLVDALVAATGGQAWASR